MNAKLTHDGAHGKEEIAPAGSDVVVDGAGIVGEVIDADSFVRHFDGFCRLGAVGWGDEWAEYGGNEINVVEYGGVEGMQEIWVQRYCVVKR